MAVGSIVPEPTLKEWQDRLAVIYPNKDKGIGPDYMMAHAFAKSSEIGRILLRGVYGYRCDHYVISSVSWLFAIATYFDIDFEDAFIARFPGRCTYCLRAPCRCDRTNKQARHDNGGPMTALEVEEEIQSKINVIKQSTDRHISLSWVEKTLGEIYPSNRALLLRGGQAFIVGKMLEEGGELHLAYSNLMKRLDGRGEFKGSGHDLDKLKKDVGDEICDLTAWLVSCWDLPSTNKNLTAEFESLYRRGCPECRKARCECEPYHVSISVSAFISNMHGILKRIRDLGWAKKTIDEAIDATQDVNRIIDLPKIQAHLDAVIAEISEIGQSDIHAKDQADRLSEFRDQLYGMIRTA